MYFATTQVLRSLAAALLPSVANFVGIHFLLGHAKWLPLPECIQYGSPLAESDLMKYAKICNNDDSSHLSYFVHLFIVPKIKNVCVDKGIKEKVLLIGAKHFHQHLRFIDASLSHHV